MLCHTQPPQWYLDVLAGVFGKHVWQSGIVACLVSKQLRVQFVDMAISLLLNRSTPGWVLAESHWTPSSPVPGNPGESSGKCEKKNYWDWTFQWVLAGVWVPLKSSGIQWNPTRIKWGSVKTSWTLMLILGVELVLVWVFESIQAASISFCDGRGGLTPSELGFGTEVGSWGLLLVCEAIFLVVGAAWVLMSVQVVDWGAVWVSVSSKMVFPTASFTIFRYPSFTDTQWPYPWFIIQIALSVPLLATSTVSHFPLPLATFLFSSFILLHRLELCPSVIHLFCFLCSPSWVPCYTPF